MRHLEKDKEPLEEGQKTLVTEKSVMEQSKVTKGLAEKKIAAAGEEPRGRETTGKEKLKKLTEQCKVKMQSKTVVLFCS